MNPLAIVTQGLAAPIPLQPMLIGVLGLLPVGAPPDPGPTVVPLGGIARSSPVKKRRKRRTDDPLALLVWLHELS